MSEPSVPSPHPEVPARASFRPHPVETGHGAVDAALARLAGLGEVPTEAHAEVYEGVHQSLRDTLNALD